MSHETSKHRYSRRLRAAGERRKTDEKEINNCFSDSNDGSFDEKEIERLWELIGEVPVNNDDEIEEDFLGFPEGTHKEEVWHWFDEEYPAGVCRLMMGGE